MTEAAYDRIGVGYRQVRQPDPRIAARIEAALGNARTVLNVGAGAGSYEPDGRAVTAVEPSAVMIEQRPPGAAPVIQAKAEALPFGDDEFDAAMAIITVHHWDDAASGLAEMRRVARERVVILTFDAPALAELWMVRDYVPRLLEIHEEMMQPLAEVTAALPGARVEPVPIPRDCTDAFWCALWDRPELHLEPELRRGSSGWQVMDADELELAERGIAALQADLESGAWDERYGHLREAAELDIGLRLIVAPAA
ncbi:MAG: methyltransferase domain-containing protein [Solirubrobacterales bacterium]